MRTLLPVRIGQVWASLGTGNRFQVKAINGNFVTAEALDGGRFEGNHAGDNCYGFHVRSFSDGTMEFSHSEQWTRDELQTLKYWERPRVRVRYGTSDNCFKELTGSIDPDGNKVWVVIQPNGAGTLNVADTFSWELLLEVLNNPHAAPLWIWEK